MVKKAKLWGKNVSFLSQHFIQLYVMHLLLVIGLHPFFMHMYDDVQVKINKHVNAWSSSLFKWKIIFVTWE